MTEDITGIDTVSDDTPIWRYMDLSKFTAMLALGSLWFAKVSLFQDDLYEGFCRVTRRPMPVDEYGPEPLTIQKTGGKPVPITLDRMMAEFAWNSADYFVASPEHLYVNSWCMADESIAMWQIYGSAARGVAIKSTVRRYREAIKVELPDSHFDFGQVKYHSDLPSASDLQIDLRDGTIPMPGHGVAAQIVKLAFHKRSCFEYEHEWRSAVYQDIRSIRGIDVDCDLEKLITAVYVGPRADEFFFNVVSTVMEKFGLTKPLEKSGLLDPPPRYAAASAV